MEMEKLRPMAFVEQLDPLSSHADERVVARDHRLRRVGEVGKE